MPRIPSASYSLTMRIEIPSTPGAFAQVAGAIAEAQGDVGAIDLVRVTRDHTVRDITVSAADSDHGQRIVDAVRQVAGVTIVNVSDRTFLMHLGGKIEVRNKVPVKTRDDLSMAYTPGVARVCLAIAEDVSKARALTIKQNTVAVVTDGTAVLGLGDIGPEAAMPVMEGKAMLFKEFAGIDALPLALNTKDTDEIVAHRQGDRARLRRHQPGGHRRAPLLRDRGAAAQRARHPGVPRRSARHRRRGAGRPAQRAQARRRSGWTS